MAPNIRRLLAFSAALATLAVALLFFLGPGKQPPSEQPASAPAPAQDLRAPDLEREGTQRTAAAETAQTETSAPPADASLPSEQRLLGLLLDAATDDPVPAAAVQLPGQSGDDALPQSDTEGQFEAFGTIRPEDTVRILDPLHGSHIRDVRGEDIERLSDGRHVLRFSIGPTQRFYLPPGTEGTASEWELRIARVTGDGRVETIPWAPGRGLGSANSPGWIRHDNPLNWHALDSSTEGLDSGRVTRQLWLEARRLDGALHAAAKIRSSVGVSPDIAVLAPVATMASLSGQVVDPASIPIERVSVIAVPAGAPRDADAWPSEQATQTADGAHAPPSLRDGLREVRTDKNGRFLLQELVPGPWQLHLVHHRTRSDQPHNVAVSAGLTDLGELELTLPRIAGELRGVLRSPSENLPKYLQVHLKAQDGSWDDLDTASVGERFQRYYATDQSRMDGQDLVLELPFKFQTVPVGSYVLRVVDPSGASWSPAEQFVTAPASDILFERLSVADQRPLRIDAVDSATGENLPQVDVRVEVDGRELTGRRFQTGRSELVVPDDPGLALFVSFPGYRLRALTRADLNPAVAPPSDPNAGEEILTLQVSLQPGWSARVETFDCEGEVDVLSTQPWLARGRHPRVAQVEAFEAGELIGTSDRDGLLLLELDSAPRSLTFRSEGYSVLGSRPLRDGFWEPDVREGVLWLLRR